MVAETEALRVFIDVQMAKVNLGRMVFELYRDAAPRTCENFRCLCTGERGQSRSKKPLCFLGSPFHRIIAGFMAQGGDFTNGDGTGGESIFGDRFDDEPFTHKHT